MAIVLLAFASNDAQADCPTAPTANADDMVVSFLASNGVQAASGSLLTSTVKEGMLVYDDTADKLKVCDGTNWVDVGSGSGNDTLASLSCASGEIAKYDGTAWACAPDGSAASPAPSDGYVQFNNAGAFGGDANLFWDNTNKRIGIGTVTPEARISLVDEANAGWVYKQYSDADGTNFRNYRARGSIAASSAVQAGDRLASFLAGGYGDTQFSSPNGGLNIYAAENFTDTAAGTYVTLSTAATGTNPAGGGTERLRVTADGNVGIGTATAPIVGAVAGRTSLSIKGASDGGVLELVSGSADTDPATVGLIQFSNPNFTPTSDVKTRVAAIAVRSTGATVGDRGGVIEFHTKKDGDILGLRMLIDGNGSVGIGTTTPQSVLQVAGGIQLGDDTATCPGVSDVKLGTLRFNGGDLQVCKSGGWSAIGSGGGATPAGNDGSIQFKSGSNLAADAANLHWDDANNRLGIGTATPDSLLHLNGVSTILMVDGTGGAAFVGRQSNGTPTSPTATLSGNQLVMLGGRGYGATGYSSTSRAYLRMIAAENFTDTAQGTYMVLATTPTGSTTTTERMRIDSAGNVGIGTASPANKLDVQGAGTISGRVYSSDSDARQILEAAGTGGRGWFLQTGNNASGLNGRFRIWDNTASAERFAIASNGNVGIGTTGPAEKLDVNGGIRTNGFVTLAGAAGATSIPYIQWYRGASRIGFMGYGANAGPTWGNRLDLYLENGAYLGINGSVAIGLGSTAPSYALHVGGQVAGAGAYVNTSDARLKTDVRALPYGLDAVMRLRPVTFSWKEQSEEWQKGRKLGLIAQEAEEIVPEIVSTAKDEMHTKSIAYGDLTPILIKSIQELKADNDNLRAELKSANDNDAGQDAALEDLRREINSLKAAR
ncbi:MAG: tail fiber domain-containing protein [Hyphomicrobium sp.]|uniref:tail fiber domain-containing protein n=1 Tax=Hyphomicrobium sp. TaxID=82 RepID=UPI0025B7AA88|nr:tail fiber domain-containing protein [Hyphomicrobium sp.]MBX9865084.1 tail fiber domain-containing protein [Hyphomicrobium sp.]